MFKVSVGKPQFGRPRVILEGRLEGPEVEELERFWACFVFKQVEVDLSGVTFIDADGERLLSAMSLDGAQLIAGGLVNKLLVEAIEQKRAVAKPSSDPGQNVSTKEGE